MDLGCHRGFFDPENNVDARDALSEILLRVDPSGIFNCTLVSKEWCEVITGTIFRQDYFKLWKNHPKFLMVLGFFIYDYDSIEMRYSNTKDIQFLPTCKLGRDVITKSKSMPDKLGYFISKTDNGFILSGANPNTFFVSSPVSGMCHRLPTPPYPKVHDDRCIANILPGGDTSSFKVILAEESHWTRTLVVHTYCSWTRKWEQSTLTCSNEFLSTPFARVDAGTVTRGGVLYWKAKVGRLGGLAVYDTINAHVSIILEPVPEVDSRTLYGVSPQGALLCASWRARVYEDENPWPEGNIKIWGLDDDNNRDWRLLYEVDVESMWAKNCGVLEHLFKAGKPRTPFHFVSFVPGKGDSIFVGLGELIFVYHFDCHKLERLRCSSHPSLFAGYRPFGASFFARYRPFTLRELGAWPPHPSKH